MFETVSCGLPFHKMQYIFLLFSHIDPNVSTWCNARVWYVNNLLFSEYIIVEQSILLAIYVPIKCLSSLILICRMAIPSLHWIWWQERQAHLGNGSRQGNKSKMRMGVEEHESVMEEPSGQYLGLSLPGHHPAMRSQLWKLLRVL